MKIRRIKARVKKPGIKSCPFCGGKPYINTYYNSLIGAWYVRVRCQCGIEGQSVKFTSFENDIEKNKAVKWWNTRHPEEARWIKKYPEYKNDGIYYCSKCGGDIDIATGEETPLDRDFYHCPICGRKMYVLERG